MEFTVSTNQEILEIAALLPQPEDGVVVRVGGVNSLESALEMRQSLLLGVSDLGWVCPGLKRLSNRLIPLLLANPNPFQEVLKLRNSGWLVRFLGREDYAGDGQPEEGALWAASTPLSNLMLRISRRVVEGVRTVGWMRGRLPDLSERITEVLLEVGVHLPPVQDEVDDEVDGDED